MRVWKTKSDSFVVSLTHNHFTLTEISLFSIFDCADVNDVTLWTRQGR
jgi:hypothetical protein